MAAQGQRELQLLPTLSSTSSKSFSKWKTSSKSLGHFDGSSSVDLQLSISLEPLRSPPQLDCGLKGPPTHQHYSDPRADDKFSCIEVLKWQTAEQIRLAAIEKAYAERVRELAQREMEMAQSEFVRARHMWERAKEDMEKAERMKERSTRYTDDLKFMEITCHSCHQRFLRS